MPTIHPSLFVSICANVLIVSIATHTRFDTPVFILWPRVLTPQFVSEFRVTVRFLKFPIIHDYTGSTVMFRTIFADQCI